MPDVEVAKQASWGATRDNIVLGSENNGIDGAHILTPMPYLISDRQGDAEQRADADVHPGAAQSRRAGDLGLQRIQGPQRHRQRLRAQGRVREEEGRRQGGQDRDDLPGRHARSLDPLLARRRRHRSRQGHLDHRRAAAADGGEHEGRQHGRVLRRRAVERAARQPEHRLHRLHHRRNLVQASGKGARHARRLGRQESERDHARC